MGLSLPAVPLGNGGPSGGEGTGLWSTPAWHEIALEALDALLALRLEIALRRRRAALIDTAVRRTLQRVNLFERRLIPQAQQAVREIRVYLGDQERAAIVRAKNARARLHRAAEEPA
jgi:V/A-type H+-transporting ATPase subunit D